MSTDKQPQTESTNGSNSPSSNTSLFSGKVTYMNREIKLTLFPNELILEQDSKKASVKLETVFSVHKDEKENSFSVFTMLFEKTSCKRIVHRFTCSTNDEVSEWVEAIQCATFGIEKGTQLKPRRLYIILNPKSGKKTALNVFNTKIKPILQIAHVTFHVEVTKKPKHGTELAREVDFSKYDEVIACGGDGTLHEVVQGLLTRKDWKTAIKHPIGIIPCGTGNGLASVAGAFIPEHAAFIVAKGNCRPLDIMSIFQDGKRYYSFLSIAWGLISDVDISGDAIRWMGPGRVILNAIRCIIRGKTYEGQIRYIPSKDNTPSQLKESAFTFKYTDNSSTSSIPEFNNGPDCPLLKTHFSNDLKSILNIEIPSPNTTNSTDQKSTQLSEMNDRMLLWTVCNVSHLASDINFAPNAKLSDGCVDMVFIRKKISKIDLLKLLANSESGEHVKHPAFEYLKCSAVSLEPKTPGSYVAIDGEPVAYKKTIGEVHRGLLRLLSM